MSITSKYAPLLNDLDDMQHSMAYAARQSTLRLAETTIVELEQRVNKLETVMGEAASMAGERWLEAQLLLAKELP